MSVAVRCANAQPSWSLAKKALSRGRFSPRPSYSAKAEYPVRCGLLAPSLVPRNTGSSAFADDDGSERGAIVFMTHVRDPAAQCARAVDESSAPMEGVGNAGCPLHPQPRVHFVVVERTRVTTSTPKRPAFPHAMVLTVSFVLSPVTGLFCH